MAMEVGSGGNKPGRASPSMNVTPLVDVMLVLLIIFMVITPLLAKQFWLYLPNKPEHEDTPPTPPDPNEVQPVVVMVMRSGEIRLGGESVALDQLAVKLKRKLAAAAERTVFFDAEDDAAFGISMKAMDEARKGGGARIVVLTDKLAQR